MEENSKYAIITPYFKEERRVLERCIASVRNQTIQADHFLIADGFPQDWVDTAGVRHFKLDRSHDDGGNTPHGVGALIAIAEEYSGIGMLDADNWLEPDHVEACLAAASASRAPCDYVIARRTFRRPDETIMPVPEEDDHVDTSCYFFLRGSFGLIPHWGMIPKRLAQACDRVMYGTLLRRGLVAARVNKPTVNYQTLYRFHYMFMREPLPPGAKPSIKHKELQDWFNSLPAREHEIACRMMGWSVGNSVTTPSNPASRNSTAAAKPRQGQPRVGRNDKCPCGSGRKYKHCHGAAS